MNPEFPEREPEGSTEKGFNFNWGTAGLALGLIIVGLVFLADNLGMFDAIDKTLNIRFNWWALFILIPVLGTASKFFTGLQASGGRVTPELRGPLVGMLVLIIVFGMLAFDLDWGTYWPFFLVAIGIGSLLVALTNRD